MTILYIFNKKMQYWREEKGHFSFLNCPNFFTIFCQVLKIEIIFFYIPSNPPPIAIRYSLTNQFFQKINDSVYFQQQQKIVTSLYKDIHPGDSWPYVWSWQCEVVLRNFLHSDKFNGEVITPAFRIYLPFCQKHTAKSRILLLEWKRYWE